MHRAAVRFRGMEAGVGGRGELTNSRAQDASSPHPRGGDGLIVADRRTRLSRTTCRRQLDRSSLAVCVQVSGA